MADVFYLSDIGDDYMELQAGGETFRLSPLSVGDRGRLQTVLRKYADNPIDVAREACKDQPFQIAQHIMDRAMDRRRHWPPAIDSPDGLTLLMQTIELQEEMIRSMLRRQHPDSGLKEAKSIAEQIGIETLGKLFSFAWTGRRPDDPNPSGSETPTQ